MTEYLYQVGLREKRTGNKMDLNVWAINNDEATHKLCSILFGSYGEYEWTGTGPLYENNELISRIV